MRQVHWQRLTATLETWGPFILLLAYGFILGPDYVRDVATDPSGWHWFLLGLWVFVMAILARMCVGRIRHRGRTPAAQPVAAENVPATDVAAAITSTPDRITATRVLREQHQGLTLADAAHLIDKARPQ